MWILRDNLPYLGWKNINVSDVGLEMEFLVIFASSKHLASKPNLHGNNTHSRVSLLHWKLKQYWILSELKQKHIVCRAWYIYCSSW